MPRLTKIYTRGGDTGKTSLGGGQRIPKSHPRIRSYGTVDELNSTIGVAIALGVCKKLQHQLLTIQNELFHLGSDLCFIEEDKLKYNIPQIEARHITAMEALIDELNESVGALENFILPGARLDPHNSTSPAPSAVVPNEKSSNWLRKRRLANTFCRTSTVCPTRCS